MVNNNPTIEAWAVFDMNQDIRLHSIKQTRPDSINKFLKNLANEDGEHFPWHRYEDLGYTVKRIKILVEEGMDKDNLKHDPEIVEALIKGVIELIQLKQYGNLSHAEKLANTLYDYLVKQCGQDNKPKDNQ